MLWANLGNPPRDPLHVCDWMISVLPKPLTQPSELGWIHPQIQIMGFAKSDIAIGNDSQSRSLEREYANSLFGKSTNNLDQFVALLSVSFSDLSTKALKLRESSGWDGIRRVRR